MTLIWGHSPSYSSRSEADTWFHQGNKTFTDPFLLIPPINSSILLILKMPNLCYCCLLTMIHYFQKDYRLRWYSMNLFICLFSRIFGRSKNESRSHSRPRVVYYIYLMQLWLIISEYVFFMSTYLSTFLCICTLHEFYYTTFTPLRLFDGCSGGK